MQNLDRKICLVTGGTGLIGSSIVKNLSNSGATVIFTFNGNKKKSNNILSDLEMFDVYSHRLQIPNENSIKKLVKFITKKFGRLDVLINNAGINMPNDFDKITAKDWDKIMNVNLKGPFIITQKFLNLLKKSKDGSIINIGSVSGQIGGPRTTHYCVSKAGLIALTQNTAINLSKFKIRCNCISPGFIESEMQKKGAASKQVQEIQKKILLNFLRKGDDIASAVNFLSSDESKYITAQTINVSGGIVF